MCMHSYEMKYEYLISREFILKQGYTNLHQLPKLESIVLHATRYHTAEPTHPQQSTDKLHTGGTGGRSATWLHLLIGQRPNCIIKEKSKAKFATSGVHGYEFTLRGGTHTMYNFVQRLAFGIGTTPEEIGTSVLQQYKAIRAKGTQHAHTINFTLPYGHTAVQVNLIPSFSGRRRLAKQQQTSVQAQYISALL